ncbi:MAG: hypothetical protein M3Q07_13630 [Pseudobdellovibrionaceae bacterium]|nr:hypothetical protein [Pseudobdellovibrionaceae bacterium]
MSPSHKYLISLLLVSVALSACNTKKSSKKDPESVPVQPTTPPSVPEPPHPFDAGLWSPDRLDLMSLTELKGAKATLLQDGPKLPQTDVYAVQGNTTETMTMSLKRTSENPGAEPYILDMKASQWNALPRPEAPLNYLSSSNILTSDHAFFWGGETDNGCGIIGGQIFDRKSAAWKTMNAEKAPSPRLYAKTHLYQNRILVFGGLAAQHDTCAESEEPRGLTNGKFYSPLTGRWEEEISVPLELVPKTPDYVSSWIVQNHLVVRLGYDDMTKLLAGNLQTGEWKVLFDNVSDPLKVQVTKLGGGIAIIQYERSKDKDKPATLRLTRVLGKSLEHSSTSEAFLPNEYTAIYINDDAEPADSRGFRAIGIKPGDSIMDTSIQFAVDVSGVTLQLVPLPVFGTSLVEWVELEKGLVGFASDGNGKLMAVYFDKKSWTTRRISGFDVDYNQITVAQAYKNKVFLTMGLETARSYVLELPEVQQL